MMHDQRLNAAFQTLIELDWLRKEQFRHGFMTLLSDAVQAKELEAVQHVLKNLTYCTSANLVTAGAEAANQIISGWKLTSHDTIIVGVSERSKSCGSTAYLRNIEVSLPLGWSTGDNIWTTFDSVFRHRNNRANLVIIDDFVGSGLKLTKLIDTIQQNPKTNSYKIHVCAFAAMEAGWDKVSDAVSSRFLAHCVMKKCISDLLTEPKRGEILSAMTSLEKHIFNTPGTYSHG